MAQSVFDTSYLISHWYQQGAAKLRDRNGAESWARELIAWHNTAAIVTPVYIEFVAGLRNSRELTLGRAFLGQFAVVDGGRILPEDWKLARRLAARIPPDGKPRQLGDCLIRAIARRLNYTVKTLDSGFPR